MGKCGLVGQGPKEEAGILVLRDQKPWARDQPPLLYWTFQKTTGGGQAHSGSFQCQAVTSRRSERVRGSERTLYPPHLGQ
ncbi:hypothetical protein I79_018598 [Cricetulus griseus]|uniref:Uncharacterized protein n=1 Tax=Cricetulus griseus TaxID=10029 RepID=G3I554_CRIGR|nr:hypothetical protein I79_018598 [Cricetulus griseus]